jgi:hypothetical protein
VWDKGDCVWSFDLVFSILDSQRYWDWTVTTWVYYEFTTITFSAGLYYFPLIQLHLQLRLPSCHSLKQGPMVRYPLFTAYKATQRSYPDLTPTNHS